MTEQQKELMICLFKDLICTFTKEQLYIVSLFLIKRFDEDNSLNLSNKQIDNMMCQVTLADKERIINDLRMYLNL